MTELPVSHQNQITTKFFTNGIRTELPITWKMYNTGYTYRVLDAVRYFLSLDEIQDEFTNELGTAYRLTEEEKQLIRDANRYKPKSPPCLYGLEGLGAEEFLMSYRGLLTAYFQSGIYDKDYGTWKDADGTQFCNVLGQDVTDKVHDGLKAIVPKGSFYGVIISRADLPIEFESLDFCALYSSTVKYKLYSIDDEDSTKYIIGLTYDSESG